VWIEEVCEKYKALQLAEEEVEEEQGSEHPGARFSARSSFNNDRKSVRRGHSMMVRSSIAGKPAALIRSSGCGRTSAMGRQSAMLNELEDDESVVFMLKLTMEQFKDILDEMRVFVEESLSKPWRQQPPCNLSAGVNNEQSSKTNEDNNPEGKKAEDPLLDAFVDFILECQRRDRVSGSKDNSVNVSGIVELQLPPETEAEAAVRSNILRSYDDLSDNLTNFEPDVQEPNDIFLDLEEYPQHAAMTVNIFATKQGYCRRAYDLIRAAFHEMPERKYLVATLLHQRAVPSWMQHWFTRTPMQPANNFPHAMFHMHRSSLDPEIQEVRHGRDYDVNLFADVFDPAIVNMDTIRNCITLSNSIDSDLSTSTFITLVDDKAICFANFEVVEEFDAERYPCAWEFRTENMDDLSLAKLTMFVLHPTFNSLSRIILRECMRQLNVRTILYVNMHDREADVLEAVATLPLTVQEDFIPLKPKPLIIEEPRLCKMQFEQIVYAFYRNESLRAPPICNLRTLVVGASTCGRALVAELCAQTEYRFENLMMLSPDIKGSQETDYTPREQERYALYSLQGSKAHTVIDSLQELDHEKKIVKTKSGMLIKYDLLILTPGMQIANPKPNAKFVFTATSNNVDINAELSDFFSSYALKLPIVIHGSGLDALTAIQGVSEKFSRTSLIVWLCGRSEYDTTLYNGNKLMQQFVLENTVKFGVKVIFNVEDLKLGVSEDNKLNLIAFSVKDDSQLEKSAKDLIERSLLQRDKADAALGVWNMHAGCILLTNKELDPAIFHALNRSPFVIINHTIVVDEGFKTKADDVYAAGTAATISGRKQNSVFHKALGLYNQNHIAIHVAQRILARVKNETWKIPVFTKAKIEWGFLMNEMVFARLIDVHGRQPKEIFESLPSVKSSICRLEADEYGYISGIQFCVPEQMFSGTSPHSIVNLVGVHSSFLVDLLEKKKRLLRNPIEELIKPNVRCMYLEEFKEFSRVLAKSLEQDTLEAVVKSLKKNNFLSANDQMKIPEPVKTNAIAMFGSKFSRKLEIYFPKNS